MEGLDGPASDWPFVTPATRTAAGNGITGLHAVAYDAETTVGTTKAFRLGNGSTSSAALRAGEPPRKELLDDAGMVWEPGDETWEAKLAALRSYRRATGRPAPPQDAVWGEGQGDSEQLAIGQFLANLRRKGGLGKNPDRAAKRAQQLTEIDPDWDCPWPLNWQRHCRVLTELVDADGHLPYIAPGVTFEGDDIGTWRWRSKSRAPGRSSCPNSASG
ncbi:Helicase associated domain protein [Streptomyces sp. NPDC006530]|uniref:Helicase associated domain protein n=1 Tax=Streptomyces sp. NPDC006530 TaxID=3364750 RepID=UPI0036C17997